MPTTLFAKKKKEEEADKVAEPAGSSSLGGLWGESPHKHPVSCGSHSGVCRRITQDLWLLTAAAVGPETQGGQAHSAPRHRMEVGGRSPDIGSP